MPVKKTKHKEEPSRYYDGLYNNAYRTGIYDTDRFNAIYRAVMQHLLEPTNILEVGCGTGELARRLVIAGHKYEGFDFSSVALSKHSLSTICRSWCGNAYDEDNWLNIPYDTLIAVEVFEHLDDLRILKFVPPDTQVVFSVPNFDSRSHVRIYPDEESIKAYYKGVLNIENIRRIDTQVERIDLHKKEVVLRKTKSIFICNAVKI